MQSVRRVNPQWLRDMREAFFDLSADGVLVYQDPVIGPLANREKGLVTLVDLNQGHIELKLHGQVERVFALSDGIGQACRDACHAYFVAFQSLCAPQPQATLAA